MVEWMRAPRVKPVNALGRAPTADAAAFPVCVAVTEQTPPPMIVIVLPAIVQTVAGEALYTTGNPELADAVSENAGTP